MDARGIRVEKLQSEQDDRCSNVQTGIQLQRRPERSKHASDNGIFAGSKVEAQTPRPCAVIGPDRIVPPPTHKPEAYAVPQRIEAWPFPENGYHRYPGLASKIPPEQRYPPRNISPRQTFQENMQRVMMPPRMDQIKMSDPLVNFSSDSGNIMVPKNVKMSVPTDAKFCEVPYLVNPVPSEQRTRVIRNSDLYVSNMPAAGMPPQTHAWNPSIGMPMHAPRPAYGGPDLHRYPEYPSCAVSRPTTIVRSHRNPHSDSPNVYPEQFYRGSERFDPYPVSSKEKFQRTRYEYVNNLSNSYQPYFANPPKYDISKPVGTHPYVGYAQVPMKYVSPRVGDHNSESYPRPHQLQGFNVNYHGENVPAKYVNTIPPISGTSLQNKLYPYPQENSLRHAPGSKGPYDPMYVDYDNRMKGIPTSENVYHNEVSASQLKSHAQTHNIPMNNGAHRIPSYMFYHRHENPSLKSYDYLSQYKNMDPALGMHNPLARIPAQFSPNIISPSDSNTSNESAAVHGTSQEDCGYVSQCSTASEKSIAMPRNRMHSYDSYKSFDNRTFLPSVGSTHAMSKSREYYRQTPSVRNSTAKEGKNIDVRQFLQMWDEEFEESTGNSKEISKNVTGGESVKNVEVTGPAGQEQLYVLGLVNVSTEELCKYEHIQKVNKLPENIKGYNNVELLDQFDEVFGSSNAGSSTVNNYLQTPKIITQIRETNFDNNARPLSPLDVEAKISQSVIHKEVGCNFEIKPCSPKRISLEKAPVVETPLSERTIEKIVNPHIQQPYLSKESQCKEENNYIKRCDKRQLRSMENDVSSCKVMRAEQQTQDEARAVNYECSVKGYESVSGICLASLPRLDTDIELNFAEVNQQFIDPNSKCESVITSHIRGISKTDSTNVQTKHGIPPHTEESLLLHYDESLLNVDSPIMPFSPNTAGDKVVTKLSKFRKLRNNGGGFVFDSHSEITNPNSQFCQRTDSVIIKNPDNIENSLPALEGKNTFAKNNSSHLIDNALNLNTDKGHGNITEDVVPNKSFLIDNTTSKSYPINLTAHAFPRLSDHMKSKYIEENILFSEGKESNSNAKDIEEINNLINGPESTSSEIPINVAINLSINSNNTEPCLSNTDSNEVDLPDTKTRESVNELEQSCKILNRSSSYDALSPKGSNILSVKEINLNAMPEVSLNCAASFQSHTEDILNLSSIETANAINNESCDIKPSDTQSEDEVSAETLINETFDIENSNAQQIKLSAKELNDKPSSNVQKETNNITPCSPKLEILKQNRDTQQIFEDNMQPEPNTLPNVVSLLTVKVNTSKSNKNDPDNILANFQNKDELLNEFTVDCMESGSDSHHLPIQDASKHVNVFTKYDKKETLNTDHSNQVGNTTILEPQTVDTLEPLKELLSPTRCTVLSENTNKQAYSNGSTAFLESSLESLDTLEQCTESEAIQNEHLAACKSPVLDDTRLNDIKSASIIPSSYFKKGSSDSNNKMSYKRFRTKESSNVDHIVPENSIRHEFQMDTNTDICCELENVTLRKKHANEGLVLKNETAFNKLIVLEPNKIIPHIDTEKETTNSITFESNITSLNLAKEVPLVFNNKEGEILKSTSNQCNNEQTILDNKVVEGLILTKIKEFPTTEHAESIASETQKEIDITQKVVLLTEPKCLTVGKGFQETLTKTLECEFNTETIVKKLEDTFIQTENTEGQASHNNLVSKKECTVGIDSGLQSQHIQTVRDVKKEDLTNIAKTYTSQIVNNNFEYIETNAEDLSHRFVAETTNDLNKTNIKLISSTAQNDLTYAGQESDNRYQSSIDLTLNKIEVGMKPKDLQNISEILGHLDSRPEPVMPHYKTEYETSEITPSFINDENKVDKTLKLSLNDLSTTSIPKIKNLDEPSYTLITDHEGGDLCLEQQSNNHTEIKNIPIVLNTTEILETTPNTFPAVHSPKQKSIANPILETDLVTDRTNSVSLQKIRHAETSMNLKDIKKNPENVKTALQDFLPLSILNLDVTMITPELKDKISSMTSENNKSSINSTLIKKALKFVETKPNDYTDDSSDPLSDRDKAEDGLCFFNPEKGNQIQTDMNLVCGKTKIAEFAVKGNLSPLHVSIVTEGSAGSITLDNDEKTLSCKTFASNVKETECLKKTSKHSSKDLESNQEVLKYSKPTLTTNHSDIDNGKMTTEVLPLPGLESKENLGAEESVSYINLKNEREKKFNEGTETGRNLLNCNIIQTSLNSNVIVNDCKKTNFTETTLPTEKDTPNILKELMSEDRVTECSKPNLEPTENKDIVHNNESVCLSKPMLKQRHLDSDIKTHTLANFTINSVALNALPKDKNHDIFNITKDADHLKQNNIVPEPSKTLEIHLNTKKGDSLSNIKQKSDEKDPLLPRNLILDENTSIESLTDILNPESSLDLSCIALKQKCKSEEFNIEGQCLDELDAEEYSVFQKNEKIETLQCFVGSDTAVTPKPIQKATTLMDSHETSITTVTEENKEHMHLGKRYDLPETHASVEKQIVGTSCQTETENLDREHENNNFDPSSEKLYNKQINTSANNCEEFVTCYENNVDLSTMSNKINNVEINITQNQILNSLSVCKKTPEKTETIQASYNEKISNEVETVKDLDLESIHIKDCVEFKLLSDSSPDDSVTIINRDYEDQHSSTHSRKKCDDLNNVECYVSDLMTLETLSKTTTNETPSSNFSNIFKSVSLSDETGEHNIKSQNLKTVIMVEDSLVIEKKVKSVANSDKVANSLNNECQSAFTDLLLESSQNESGQDIICADNISYEVLCESHNNSNDHTEDCIKINNESSVTEDMTNKLIGDDVCFLSTIGQGEKVCDADTEYNNVSRNDNSRACTPEFNESGLLNDNFNVNSQYELSSSDPDYRLPEYEEIWIDDVACVETVVSEDVLDDSTMDTDDHMVETYSVDYETYNQTQDFQKDRLGLTSNITFDPAKIKTIYGSSMCNDDNLHLVEKLYKTPHMDVNNRLNDMEPNFNTHSIVNKNDLNDTDFHVNLHSEIAALGIIDNQCHERTSLLLKIKTHQSYKLPIYENGIHSKSVEKGLRCRFTEKHHYSSGPNNTPNQFGTKPLLTKAAQKYIPPLKKSSDLKIKLPLPKRSLLKLKQLKIDKQNDKTLKLTTLSNKQHYTKAKPKFEDVLKNIDDLQYKMNKLKNKKRLTPTIPKVIIKKNENGSHYASTASKSSYNPDLTGRKWQPWVYLEKSTFVDKMIARKITRAVFCPKKKAYVLLEKRHLKKSMSLETVTQTCKKIPLKYTITLNQKIGEAKDPTNFRISPAVPPINSSPKNS